MVELVGAVELGWAGGGAAPAGDGGGDDGAAGLVDRDYVSAEDAGDAGWREGQRERIGGEDAGGDRADVDGVGGIGVENAEASAVVVAEGGVGLLGAGTWAVEGAGRGGVRVHHGAPDGGMAEAEKMAELRGGGAAAELFAEGVGGDDAGEGQDAGSEGRVGLIEADGVDAVGAAGVLVCGARQRCYGGGQQGGAADGGPHGERLGNNLFDFGETPRGGLVLREDRNWAGAEGGAPADGEAGGRG